LWAVISPWVLSFQGTTAMTVHVVIGIAVAVLAAIEIWVTTQNPPRLTAGR
jgi:cytochrome b561